MPLLIKSPHRWKWKSQLVVSSLGSVFRLTPGEDAPNRTYDHTDSGLSPSVAV